MSARSIGDAARQQAKLMELAADTLAEVLYEWVEGVGEWEKLSVSDHDRDAFRREAKYVLSHPLARAAIKRALAQLPQSYLDQEAFAWLRSVRGR